MKNFKYIFFVIFMAVFALQSGCSDDNDEEISPFVGSFRIVIPEPQFLSIKTVEMGTISVSISPNITGIIHTELFSGLKCYDSNLSEVELRRAFSMYLSCQGQNQLNAGTWEEIDQATIKLNRSSPVLPSSSAAMVLTVTNIIQNNGISGFQGTTIVSLPKEILGNLVAPLTLDPAIPELVPVTSKIWFWKIVP